ncbi:hypothetical protein ACFQ3C_03790 [Seohaeicola saemankumensis]|uniref:Uncharacterized protein n=1 Tax=Seohaeicola saemankumensis TaxID=481181 RepID=A0ABW3T9Q5_9RHOB
MPTASDDLVKADKAVTDIKGQTGVAMLCSPMVQNGCYAEIRTRMAAPVVGQSKPGMAPVVLNNAVLMIPARPFNLGWNNV